MVFLAPKLSSYFETFEKLNSDKYIKETHSQTSKQSLLLQATVEGFIDGLLVLTNQGQWLYANTQACRIFYQLLQETAQPNVVAKGIWHVCQSLIESYELFPEQKIVIESEIDTGNSNTLRIRVSWLVLEENDSPYLLVTLEDRQESTENAAIADAVRYGLTRREADVWLLRRANYSYQEIAAKLYITLNTVKKHMKNIYAKQQAQTEELSLSNRSNSLSA